MLMRLLPKRANTLGVNFKLVIFLKRTKLKLSRKLLWSTAYILKNINAFAKASI